MPKKLPRKKSLDTTKDEFAEAVETLENESMELPKCDIAVNENGESEEFELLAGYLDDDGVLHKTFVIREMNARKMKPKTQDEM